MYMLFQKCYHSDLRWISIEIQIDWQISEQQLVDCSTADFGCKGGFYDWAWEYIDSAGGQVTNASYPYIGVQSSCKSSKGIIAAKVSSVVTYIKENDTKTMMTLLSQNRLIAVFIAAVNSFFNYKYVYFLSFLC